MWRVSLLFVGACSFAFMQPPTPEMTSRCNDTYQAPVPDTIIGAAALASAVGLGAFAKADQYGQDAKVGYWLVLVPTALLFSSSAVYGYISRDHCERVRNDSRTDLTARHDGTSH